MKIQTAISHIGPSKSVEFTQGLTAITEGMTTFDLKLLRQDWYCSYLRLTKFLSSSIPILSNAEDDYRRLRALRQNFDRNYNLA